MGEDDDDEPGRRLLTRFPNPPVRHIYLCRLPPRAIVHSPTRATDARLTCSIRLCPPSLSTQPHRTLAPQPLHAFSHPTWPIRRRQTRFTSGTTRATRDASGTSSSSSTSGWWGTDGR